MSHIITEQQVRENRLLKVWRDADAQTRAAFVTPKECLACGGRGGYYLDASFTDLVPCKHCDATGLAQ